MLHRLAWLLSVVFHPLLVPTYLVWTLGYQLPSAVASTMGASIEAIVLRVWGITFWLPALLIWGLQRLGFINSVELYERRQRPLPLLIAAIAFGGAALHVGMLYPATSLATMLAGVGLSVLLTLIITLYWKISAHGMGMGGALGLFAALLLHARLPLPQAWLWLLLAGLLSAAVGWARLRLQAHTPAQVLAGLALGTGVSVCVCLYAWPAVSP